MSKLNDLITKLTPKHPDKTADQIAELAKSIIANKKERNGKDGIKKSLSSVALAAVTSPKFWKTVGSVILKANHPQWYGADSNKFTGPIGPYINGPVGNTVILANTVVQLDLEQMFSLDMIQAQFSGAVTAFDKRLGFASGITVEQILTYLRKGITYLGAFASMKRFYNYQNLPIFKHHVLGDKFKYSVLYGLDIDASSSAWSGFKGTKDMPLPNISNYEWSNKYADQALTLVALPHHFEFISYLFDGVFSNGIDSAVNTFVEFIPKVYGFEPENIKSATTTSTWWKTYIDRALEQFESAKDANPYILQFLQTIGYDYIVPTEWIHRDPVGQSLATVVDPTIIGSLTNMFNKEYLTNKLMVSFSTDVDPSFDVVFEDTTIGEIGQQLKFNIMDAQIVFTHAFKISKSTAGAQANFGWNNPTWSPTTANTAFRVGQPIHAVDTANVSGSVSSGIITQFLKILPYYEFMGIENFSHATKQLGMADVNGTTIISITDITNSSETHVVGSDVKQINDLELALQVIKVNFTLGTSYLTLLSKVVRDATTALTLR